MRTINRTLAFVVIVLTTLVGSASVASAGGDEMPCDGPHCVDLTEDTTTTNPPPTTTPPTTTQPTLPTPTLPTPTLPVPTLPPGDGGSNDLTTPTMPPLVPPTVPQPDLVIPEIPDARDLAEGNNKSNGGNTASVSSQTATPSSMDTLPSAEPAGSMGANRVATSWNWPLIITIGLFAGTLWGWYDRQRNRFIVAAATDDENDDTVA